uniref:Uncharacterized protein n=1 Tax=Mesocestoides corti TaxID=53468 RepID=A0A5K3EMA7_MESCO
MEMRTQPHFLAEALDKPSAPVAPVLDFFRAVVTDVRTEITPAGLTCTRAQIDSPRPTPPSLAHSLAEQPTRCQLSTRGFSLPNDGWCAGAFRSPQVRLFYSSSCIR